MKEKFTQKHQKLLGAVSIIVFVLFVALVCWFIGRPMIKLAEQPEYFRDWIDSKEIFGRLIFIGMVVVQVIFAIIPGEPLEIGAGYAFGAIEGTVLCLIGGMLGAVAVFAFVRKYGIRVVEVFYPVSKINSLKILADDKKRNILFWVIFLLPGTPKDLCIYLLGLTKISNRDFILITTLARLPSIVTSTVGGNALGIKNYVLAIVVFAVTIAISLIGVWCYNHFTKNKK